MKIEEGKYYRTRDGRKKGPLVFIRDAYRENFHNDWAWMVQSGKASDGYWDKNGRYPGAGFSGLDDLIAEWTDEPTGPVRTRTVTEIVPGLYGRVALTESTYCDDGDVAVGLTPKFGGEAKFMHINAAELRAAAAIFIQLADALEGGAE